MFKDQKPLTQGRPAYALIVTSKGVFKNEDIIYFLETEDSFEVRFRPMEVEFNGIVGNVLIFDAGHCVVGALKVEYVFQPEYTLNVSYKGKKP
jgi:hypothetical protein